MSRNRYCATTKIRLNKALFRQFRPSGNFGLSSAFKLNPLSKTLRQLARCFDFPAKLILSDNSRQPQSQPAIDWLQNSPQHTWYVGVGVHWNATSTAQRSRYWLPHAFGLHARLRAFSFGYRVLPIPKRNGQSPKSSKSAASGYRRRPTRGGTTGSKGHYFSRLRYAHDFPAGRRPPRVPADDFGDCRSIPRPFAAEAKSSGATPALSGRTTPELRTSEVRPLAPPRPPPPPKHPLPSAASCLGHSLQTMLRRHHPKISRTAQVSLPVGSRHRHRLRPPLTRPPDQTRAVQAWISAVKCGNFPISSAPPPRHRVRPRLRASALPGDCSYTSRAPDFGKPLA